MFWMVVQMFHPESFRSADVIFFSFSSSNSVQLAPQDKSPSRGSLTTWSTVNRQPKALTLTCSVWSLRTAGRPQRLPDISGSPEAALALALSPRLKLVFVCVNMNFSLECSLNQSPVSRHVGLFLLAPHPDGSSGNWVSGSPDYSLGLLGGM